MFLKTFNLLEYNMSLKKLPEAVAAAHQQNERFEKLDSPVIIRFREIFLRGCCLKEIVGRPSEWSRTSRKDPESSGIYPKQAPNPKPCGYTVFLDRIFIPLVTLKAAGRNQASRSFLSMVVK